MENTTWETSNHPLSGEKNYLYTYTHAYINFNSTEETDFYVKMQIVLHKKLGSPLGV